MGSVNFQIEGEFVIWPVFGFGTKAANIQSAKNFFFRAL